MLKPNVSTESLKEKDTKLTDIRSVVNVNNVVYCKTGTKWPSWKLATVVSIDTEAGTCICGTDGKQYKFGMSFERIRPNDFQPSPDYVEFLRHHIRWKTKNSELAEIITTFKITWRLHLKVLLLECLKTGNNSALKWLLIMGTKHSQAWSNIEYEYEANLLQLCVSVGSISAMREILKALPHEALRSLISANWSVLPTLCSEEK